MAKQSEIEIIFLLNTLLVYMTKIVMSQISTHNLPRERGSGLDEISPAKTLPGWS